MQLVAPGRGPEAMIRFQLQLGAGAGKPSGANWPLGAGWAATSIAGGLSQPWLDFVH